MSDSWLRNIADDWERVRNGLLNHYCVKEFRHERVQCRFCPFEADMGEIYKTKPTGFKVCAVHVMDAMMEEMLGIEEEA